jgi:hypothetical protein
VSAHPITLKRSATSQSKYIDGDRLESICKVANIAQFVGDDGLIDAVKVERSLSGVRASRRPPTDELRTVHRGTPRAGTR